MKQARINWEKKSLQPQDLNRKLLMTMSSRGHKYTDKILYAQESERE